MSADSSLDVLIAQIQIQLERLESLVVTCPTPHKSADQVATRIVDGLRARDIATVLYLPADSGAAHGSAASNGAGARHAGVEANGSPRKFTAAQVGTPQLARSLLVSPGVITVASAPGILEDPSSLFLASAADAVLIVAEAGRTTRAALRRARLELDTAGAHVVGAVLVG